MELFSTDPSGYGRRLSDSISEGMAPFRIAMTKLYNDFDIDHNRYKVVGVAVLMSGREIGHHVFVDRDDLLAWPEYQIERIAQEFSKAFRNRSDYSLAPLIYLGEN